MKVFILFCLLSFFISLSSCGKTNNFGLWANATLDRSTYDIYKKLPKNSFVLAINNDKAILGSLDKSQITFLDLLSGETFTADSPIAPQVALELGDKKIAIFGFETEPLRDGKVLRSESNRFLIINRENYAEIEICEFSEPVAIYQGSFVNSGELLIFNDQSKGSLVFINTDAIIENSLNGNCVSDSQEKDRDNSTVPVRTFLLDNNPYNIEIISNNYMAVSYLNKQYCDIFNINNMRIFDSISPRVFTNNLLISSLQFESEENYLFVLDEKYQEIDTFSFHDDPKKNIYNEVEFIDFFPLDLNIDDNHVRKFSTNPEVAFQAFKKNKTIWLGYKNKLMILRFEKANSNGRTTKSLKLKKELKLPLKSIKKIIFFDDSQKVAISSPEQGAIIISPVKEILAQ